MLLDDFYVINDDDVIVAMSDGTRMITLDGYKIVLESEAGPFYIEDDGSGIVRLKMRKE